MPAGARNIPRAAGREVEEEGAPVLRDGQGLIFQYLLDGSDRTITSDGTKNGIFLQVLQVLRSGLRPRRTIIAPDSDFPERIPDDSAHRGGIIGAECPSDADPAAGSKVFQLRLIQSVHCSSTMNSRVPGITETPRCALDAPGGIDTKSILKGLNRYLPRFANMAQ